MHRFAANILIGNTAAIDTTASGGCTGCTISHQLCASADPCGGTDAIIGMPIFVGGAMPSAWSGWELADGSLGENAAHDGLDVGITYVPDAGDGGAPSAGAGGMPPASRGTGATSGASPTDPESAGCACRASKVPLSNGWAATALALAIVARRRRLTSRSFCQSDA